MNDDFSYTTEEEDDHTSGYDDSDRRNMLQAVIASDRGWQAPSDSLKTSPDWRPDLIHHSGDVFHLHTVPTLPGVWKRRIQAARRSGHPVKVAAPLEGWYPKESLLTFADLDIRPVILKRKPHDVTAWGTVYYRSVAELISLEKFTLDPDTFRQIGHLSLDRALSATDNYEKGWRFEDFLCLFFNQVSYFEIQTHNFKNTTSEIDIIINNTRIVESYIPSSPIVLVSAKNEREKDPVGVPALSRLRDNMDNARGTCKLGFLCSSRKIASTVHEHYVGYRLSDKVIVMLDGTTLRALIDKAENLDKEIQNLFINAALS